MCQRFFELVRKTLPAPDGMIRITVPVKMLAQRRNLRNRAIDIAQAADLPKIEALLQEWFSGSQPLPPCLVVDTSDNDPTFSNSIARIHAFIENLA